MVIIMFKDYERKGSVIEVTLEDGRLVKISSKYIDNVVKSLDIDEEEAILTWLEDEEYIINEDQAELNEKAKANKANKVVKAKAVAAKTQKERVKKENPVKEEIITKVAEFLINGGYQDVAIENKSKIITFKVGDREFKFDLVEKRKPSENKKQA